MRSELERCEQLFGCEGIKKLHRSSVIIFGIGGVGGHALEVLARSGIGAITLVDADNVDITNINRQIIALHSTVGRPKVEVAAERIRDINPNCNITVIQQFYLPGNADSIDISQYDYVVDCIDTVAAKMELIRRCAAAGIPIISSMGAGNKMNPTMLKVADIYKTSVDPLAKVIRKKCKESGIKHLKVVYSEEASPLLQKSTSETSVSSNAFVPATMGIIIASEVVKDLLGYGLSCYIVSARIKQL